MLGMLISNDQSKYLVVRGKAYKINIFDTVSPSTTAMPSHLSFETRVARPCVGRLN